MVPAHSYKLPMLQARVLILAGLIVGCHGAIRFASYYQDHVVLQRGPQQAVVWGHATKIGDTVKVQLSGKGAVTAKVTKDTAGHGVWKVKLPAVTDKGPFSVTATSSEGKVTIKDVLFGDVWLCSGQSNMGFFFRYIKNHDALFKAAMAYKDVRFMTVGHKTSTSPHSDLEADGGIATSWTKPAAPLGWFSAVCWFYGQYLYDDLQYPIGLVESDVGGTPIEPWSSPNALNACHGNGKRQQPPHEKSVLWNTMINPILDMTIYGAIWYQGESNSGRSDLYACQFPALIKDWRQKFHDGSMGETGANFPFGFVQLAPYRNDFTRVGGFPALRWSQTAKHGQVPNTDLQNVFMAVAMDLPDFDSPIGSLHPRYKQDVARRLKLSARAVAYNNKTVKYQGPFPRTITHDAAHHTLRIVYDHGPIKVNNNNGFEACCSNSRMNCGSNDQWVASPIQSQHASDVVLTTSGCGNKHVVGVRYAWRETPCNYKQCSIYGQDTSLPAPPYLHVDGFGHGPTCTIIG